MQPEFCMAQVGTPVGVGKPVLWEPNPNLASPLHGKARRENERVVRGGRRERGRRFGLLYAQRELFPARPELII